MGVVGIETAFCVMYTYLVREGIITLERLMELLSTNARERFSIKSDVGFSVWQLDKEHTVDPEKFISKGRSTPFENARLYGKNLMTVYGGKVVYSATEKA
jgi:dihydroorotase